MPKCSHTQDERFELVIKGALFEGYSLCHDAREAGNDPLKDGAFTEALLALGTDPKTFLKEIRDKYDPIRAKKKESSGRGSGRSSNDPGLADAPYDPSLCSKRVWNQGLGAQCQQIKMDDCEFCTRCTKEFGNKGALPFGYFDQDKPDQDLVTGKTLPWKTEADLDNSKEPKMKVGEIREKLEELGLDTSGKKAELIERLNAATETIDAMQPEAPLPQETPKKKVKKVKMIKKKTPSKDVVSRNVEEIVGANGQVIELDLGAGVGLIAPKPAEVVEAPKPAEVVEAPKPAEVVEAPKPAEVADGWCDDETEEIEVSDEEEEEEAGEGELEVDDFDSDDYVEIDYEDMDYLHDETSNKVFTMDGTHVGSWDDEDGIIWLKTQEVIAIKEQNGH